MSAADQGARVAAYAVPDVYLNDAHLAAARAVLDRVIGIDNVQLAFVSGSLAAGLGHGQSDVDVYVLAAAGEGPAMLSYREGGTVVQINPVTPEHLARIASVCAEYTDTAQSRPQSNLIDAELQRPLRYAIGTVLVDRGSGLPSAEDAIATVRRIQMNRHAYLISGHAEDAMGGLQIGDALTALQASQMGVEYALECALAGVGDVYLGRKFLLRRTARAAGLREVLADAWAYLRQPDDAGDLTQIADLVIARLLFCSHLVGRSMLEGWDKPLDLMPAFSDQRADGGPVRSPWVLPVRFASSWGMAGPLVGYRVTGGMVRVWQSLDGRGRDAVYRGFADDPAQASFSRELLDKAIDQLVEKAAAVSDSGSIF